MRIFLLLSAILLSAGLAAAQSVTPRTALDAVIDDASVRGFSGAVIVGDLDGATYQRIVPSLANEPSRMDELWRWAGVTRQITAILIMQEVEKGHLLLDAVVTAYLPDFKGPTGSELTLRQLLQHNSGLPGLPAGVNLATGDEVRASHAAAPEACAGPPKGNPGERIAYTDCDYLLLGAVLETVTGKGFNELVRDRIGAPAGAAVGALPPGFRLMPTHVSGPDEQGQPENLSTYGAGGNILGTPGDLLRVDVALMIGRYLSAPSLRALWTADPHLGNSALGARVFPVTLKGCGTTVEIVESRGVIGGTQLRNIIAPKLGRVLIVFSNGPRGEFGDVEQGTGLAYDLLNAGFCTAAG